MDRQYKPIKLTIDDTFPVIIYVAKDEVPVVEILPTQNDVKDYVRTLLTENPNIIRGQYAVVFVWRRHDTPMADVWMYKENDHSKSGPLLENFCFAGKEQSVLSDLASGDTIIALAAEEQKRRRFDGFAQYIADNSPAVFPTENLPKEEYPTS